MSTSQNDTDLNAFLEQAKERGVPDDTVIALLRQSGWSEKRSYGALGAYYARALNITVPLRGHYAENARDAFYYLLNFITLAFWMTALGEIWYTLIARWFPDATSPYYMEQNLTLQISWQIATIAIALPIFAYVHSVIRKTLREQPEAYDSGVRKWLTYLALVLASLIVLTDGVWFINSLLRGEITIRFILDSLVLLVLGGGVLGYYFSTINPPEPRS